MAFPARRLFDGHYERHHDPRAAARADGILCGIDPMHLGIIFIVNLELGYTPPWVSISSSVTPYLIRA